MENKNLKIIILVMSLLFITYAILNPPFSMSSAPVSSTELCMDFSKYKPATLKHSLVGEMVSNYRKNQLVSIESAAVNPVANDAQSIWFNLDTIKKFIYHIEKGFQQQKPGAKANLGLRLYYAAYPLKTKWSLPGYEGLTPLLGNPVTLQYEKKHTLIMIPTLEIHGVNADFNPIDSATYNGFNSPTNPFSTPGYVPMALSVDVMGKNHGHLIPPYPEVGCAF